MAAPRAKIVATVRMVGTPLRICRPERINRGRRRHPCPPGHEGPDIRNGSSSRSTADVRRSIAQYRAAPPLHTVAANLAKRIGDVAPRTGRVALTGKPL